MADIAQLLFAAGIGGAISAVLNGRKRALSEVAASSEVQTEIGNAVSKGHTSLLESTRLRDVIDNRVDHKARNQEMVFGERLNAMQRDISRLEKAQESGQREVMDTLGRLFDKVERIGERTANVRGRIASQADADETEFSP